MNKLILPIMLLALILCFGTAHANTTVPFAIDGPQVTNSFSATGCSSTCSVVLSTSYADDIIVVGISENSHPTSITMSDSASAINWIGSASTPIAEVPVKGTLSTLFLFEGIASPTLSSDLITETLSGGSGKTGMFVYAVSGANAITPIDSLATAQGNDTSSSITSQTSNSFSTSNANDMIMYFVGGGTANPAISAPMPGSIGSLQSTLIGNIIQAPNLPWMLSEYANAMTLQASITASISWTNSASVVAWITQALEQAPPPPASILSLSNTLIDQGQSILFTATETNPIGTAPWTYNYNIVNSITPSTVIANMLFTGCTLTTNSFFWTPPYALYTANTFEANVIITNLANSIASPYTAFGYNSALKIPVIEKSGSLFDSGQSLTLTALASGGTQPYIYTWQNITGATTLSGCLTSSSTCTFTLASPSQGNSFKFNVIVQDSPTIANTANAVANSITVNAMPTFIITPSNIILDSGQWVDYVIQATAATGTAPFTIELYNSTGSGKVQSNIIIPSIGGSNNIKFLTSSLIQANSFIYQYLITDYGASSNSAYTTITNTITVNTKPSLTMTLFPNPVSTGGGMVFTVSDTGGTSQFNTQVYNASASGAEAPNVLITAAGGSNVVTITAQAGSSATSYLYNAIAYDAGTTSPYLFNSITTLLITNAGGGSNGGTPGGGGGGGGVEIIYNATTKAINTTVQVITQAGQNVLPIAGQIQLDINGALQALLFYPITYSALAGTSLYSYIPILIIFIALWGFANYSKNKSLKTLFLALVIITVLAVGYGYSVLVL